MPLLGALISSYLSACLDLAPYAGGIAVLIAIAGIVPTANAFLAAGLALFLGFTPTSS